MFNKQEFINNLIQELNRENEDRIYHRKDLLDVCYMVSVVDQQIEKCTELIKDLDKYNYCINDYNVDNSQGYINGKINILIEKPEEEKESEFLIDTYYNHYYTIEFTYDPRYWGYCMCKPTDKDYNEEHKCCGHGCDWDAPAIRITKIIDLSNLSWKGDEADYWEYEKQFNLNEKNKNEEVEKQRKENERLYIENQIAELQAKLHKLNEEE